MRRWILTGIVLVLLACLVPWSSRRPDAVQHVLGLPGGVDRAWKAAAGILTAGLLMMIIVKMLRNMGGKP
jgi:hypothetical protein